LEFEVYTVTFSLKAITRDVKVSSNPWANPAHHGFEPDRVEKTKIFVVMGQNGLSSLNPRTMRVRAEFEW